MFGNMEMDKMSILVERVTPAGLLLPPALGMVSGAAVWPPCPSPQHVSQNHYRSATCRAQSWKAWISCYRSEGPVFFTFIYSFIQGTFGPATFSRHFSMC